MLDSSKEDSSPRRDICSPSEPQLDVSENSGTPKLSILIGFSIMNHPFWGTRVPLFLETPSCLRIRHVVIPSTHPSLVSAR